MNYEEKYKQALEIARECLQDCTITTIARDYILEIFPELKEKESEDERIRQELCDFLRDNMLHQDAQYFISWLEKQNKQKFSNIPSRETILAVWELGNDWKDLTKGVCSTEHGTQLKYIQNHWQESSYYDNIVDNIPTLTDKDYDKLFINCKH